MGTTYIVVVLLFLVAFVITIVICIVVFGKRNKAQSRQNEGKIKVIEEEQTWELEQKVAPIIEEEERSQDEIENRRLEEETRSTEEAIRRVEEDHNNLEERDHSEGEEARSKTGEVYRIQNELYEIEEEIHHKEESQPKSSDLESEVVHTRRAPINGGGRPRTLIKKQENQSNQITKPRLPKPEIVCWKKERQWVVGIEVPRELLEYPGFQVLQSGLPLLQDELKEATWFLEREFSEITVSYIEGEDFQQNKISLEQEGYLLFKLCGQNQNEGRRVKSPSLGWHLVITPENWNRDEVLSGSPLVAPEPVSIKGYDAHFFINERDSSNKIAFLKPMGELVIIESKVSRFSLIGHRINEASEDIGPLFGEKFPKIYGSYSDVWKDIGTIVIGEEGGGKGRWRRVFCPVLEDREQVFPPDVAERHDGWYFLRFYDKNDDLIESLDFRVISALRDIKVFQSSPFPLDGKHESVRIDLHHESDYAIHPADNLTQNIQMEENNNRTRLTIPPDPKYDETRWLLGSSSVPQVQVTFIIERLWWVISNENCPPSEWSYKLLTLTRDDITAKTNQAIWLRLPKRRWVNKVHVGFERSKAKPFQVKVTEREISIPLRRFCDCQEMEEQDRDHFLYIWIERGKETIEGPIAIFPALIGSILSIGYGRKKRANATVVLRKGDGAIKVNGLMVDDYFSKTPFRAKQFLRRLVELAEIKKLLSLLDVSIDVKGSSPNTIQQVKASAHALARALIKYDYLLDPLLTQTGFKGVKVVGRYSVKTRRQSDESN